MSSPLLIRADASYSVVIRAVADLFEKLKLPAAFVGTTALSAWTGSRVNSGAIDVLAMLSPERMRQVPMMAGQRGFTVDGREIERAEELDLIPLKFENIRVHVLMATNALYGKMLAASVEARLDEVTVRVVRLEDLALLLLMSDEHRALQTLIDQRLEFDIEAFNRRLETIGLAGRKVLR